MKTIILAGGAGTRLSVLEIVEGLLCLMDSSLKLRIFKEASHKITIEWYRRFLQDEG